MVRSFFFAPDLYFDPGKKCVVTPSVSGTLSPTNYNPMNIFKTHLREDFYLFLSLSSLSHYKYASTTARQQRQKT